MAVARNHGCFNQKTFNSWNFMVIATYSSRGRYITMVAREVYVENLGNNS